MDVYPLTEAGAHLGELVDEARHRHRPVTISEHGKPVAVIIGVEDLADLEDSLAVARHEADKAADRVTGVAAADLDAALDRYKAGGAWAWPSSTETAAPALRRLRDSDRAVFTRVRGIISALADDPYPDSAVPWGHSGYYRLHAGRPACSLRSGRKGAGCLHPQRGPDYLSPQAHETVRSRG
jgi:prevent-host-death family protein